MYWSGLQGKKLLLELLEGCGIFMKSAEWVASSTGICGQTIFLSPMILNHWYWILQLLCMMHNWILKSLLLHYYVFMFCQIFLYSYFNGLSNYKSSNVLRIFQIIKFHGLSEHPTDYVSLLTVLYFLFFELSKVGDFGLARWQPDGDTEVQTRVIGTFGYVL